MSNTADYPDTVARIEHADLMTIVAGLECLRIAFVVDGDLDTELWVVNVLERLTAQVPD